MKTSYFQKEHNLHCSAFFPDGTLKKLHGMQPDICDCGAAYYNAAFAAGRKVGQENNRPEIKSSWLQIISFIARKNPSCPCHQPPEQSRDTAVQWEYELKRRIEEIWSHESIVDGYDYNKNVLGYIRELIAKARADEREVILTLLPKTIVRYSEDWEPEDARWNDAISAMYHRILSRTPNHEGTK